MSSRIATIAIDAVQPKAVADFWCAVLDVRADGLTTAGELDRLLALGARPTDVGQGPDVSWVVLSDPEGNEFCLLSRSVQDVRPDP